MATKNKEEIVKTEEAAKAEETAGVFEFNEKRFNNIRKKYALSDRSIRDMVTRDKTRNRAADGIFSGALFGDFITSTIKYGEQKTYTRVGELIDRNASCVTDDGRFLVYNVKEVRGRYPFEDYIDVQRKAREMKLAAYSDAVREDAEAAGGITADLLGIICTIPKYLGYENGMDDAIKYCMAMGHSDDVTMSGILPMYNVVYMLLQGAEKEDILNYGKKMFPEFQWEREQVNRELPKGWSLRAEYVTPFVIDCICHTVGLGDAILAVANAGGFASYMMQPVCAINYVIFKDIMPIGLSKDRKLMEFVGRKLNEAAE